MSAALAVEDTDEVNPTRRIIIPYTPRAHFVPFHASAKRFRAMVVHRRGGKTVCIGNEHIKNALSNTRQHPPPRYGYIGPSFSQAKDTIWQYLKQYTHPIPGVRISESDLQVTLPNGAIIALYPGSDAYERMRGLYFDGVALDEYALLNPDAWPSVVRPALADYKGYGIIAGTSNGDDHFHELIQRARGQTDLWDVFDIKASQTDAIHPDELAEMRQEMGEQRYLREMENNFLIPVEGAYYGEALQKLDEAGRITAVPHDPRSQVVAMFDLGIRDTMAVWFIQRVGREIRVFDYAQYVGKGLEFVWDQMRTGHRKDYSYSTIVMPHDVMVRELVTGRSRYEQMLELEMPITVCPRHDPEDRIAGTRTFLPTCVFDAQRCANGISALKSYKMGRNGKPLHDWASHAADSFGYGVMASDLVFAWMGNVVQFGNGALRRKVRGVH